MGWSPCDIQYVSQNAADSGVSRSQVIPYVNYASLCGWRIELHTLEGKVAQRPEALSEGVDWRPHRFGPPGKVGAIGRILGVAKSLRRHSLVHARGDLIAFAAALRGHPRWIWDMRSLWREERIDSGRLREGSLVDRFIQTLEVLASVRAGRIITLSEAVHQTLGRRHGRNVAKKAVCITTCVDTDMFQFRGELPHESSLAMIGTLGPVYDVPAMLEFARAFYCGEVPNLVSYGPIEGYWKSFLYEEGVPHGPIEYGNMPEIIARNSAVLCLRRLGSRSLAGAMPIKVGEALAVGRPVVANSGLGDFDKLAREYGCGVTVRAKSDFESAAERLHALLNDPDTPRRCRSAALYYFSLRRGLTTLGELYEEMNSRAK